MGAKLVDPDTTTTFSFDWGLIKPLVTGSDTDAEAVSMVQAVLLPGFGHERHEHPEADEVLYILAGEGEQMLDDGEPFAIHAGQTVLVPKGVWHSTMNKGWEPLVLLAIYAPAGPEEVLRQLPDFAEVPAGQATRLQRAEGS